MLLIHCYPLTKCEVSKQQSSTLSRTSLVYLWKVNGVVRAAEGRKAITVISETQWNAFCLCRDCVYLHRLTDNTFYCGGDVKQWHHYDWNKDGLFMAQVHWSLFAGLVSVSLLTDTMQKITCNVVHVTKKRVSQTDKLLESRKVWSWSMQTIVFVIVSC